MLLLTQTFFLPSLFVCLYLAQLHHTVNRSNENDAEPFIPLTQPSRVPNFPVSTIQQHKHNQYFLFMHCI